MDLLEKIKQQLEKAASDAMAGFIGQPISEEMMQQISENAATDVESYLSSLFGKRVSCEVLPGKQADSIEIVWSIEDEPDEETSQ